MGDVLRGRAVCQNNSRIASQCHVEQVLGSNEAQLRGLYWVFFILLSCWASQVVHLINVGQLRERLQQTVAAESQYETLTGSRRAKLCQFQVGEVAHAFQVPARIHLQMADDDHFAAFAEETVDEIKCQWSFSLKSELSYGGMTQGRASSDDVRRRPKPSFALLPSACHQRRGWHW